MDVSKENNFFVSGHNDNRLRLWDPRSNENENMKRIFKSHKGWISSVSINPSNQNYFLSSSHDKTVKIWDLRSSIPLFSLPESKDKVLASVWGNHHDDSEFDYILQGGADTKLTISKISKNISKN
jgi:ribosome biogenesis protein